jgi:hypothetical protein
MLAFSLPQVHANLNVRWLDVLVSGYISSALLQQAVVGQQESRINSEDVWLICTEIFTLLIKTSHMAQLRLLKENITDYHAINANETMRQHKHKTEIDGKIQ